MDRAFLRQVAESFVNDPLEDFTFVFPNRRSSLFFLKHLGEVSSKPVFSPRIFTIDKLFGYLSSLEVADDLSLVFRLWKVYRDYQTQFQKNNGVKEADVKVEGIDEFFSWGRIILSDFNDVDQYMVDATRLFSNIKDLNQLKSDASVLSERQYNALKRLVNMKSDVRPDAHVKRRYLEIWDMLLPLYQSFRSSLLEDGLAYQGMQYREVAQNLDNLEEKLSGLGTVVFVGFSAPSECEKMLMRRCRNKGGIFFWDYYSEWIQKDYNRSSHLIGKCVKEFPSTRPLGRENGGCVEGGCHFRLIPAAGPTEQAMIASDILKMIKSEGVDGLDTAVVVADETLLIPLLEFAGEDDLNITMGFPLKATSAASFFFTLFDLHLRSRLSSDRVLVPGDLVLSILGHPYAREMDPEGASVATRYIQANNYYMLDSSEINKDQPLDIGSESPLGVLLKMIVPSVDMYSSDEDTDVASGMIAHYRSIAEYLFAFLDPSERLFLNKFVEILNRVSSSGIRFFKERSVYSVIRSAVRSATVPFRGEPLVGTQIMGALETRALDFDRIVFLSFNEGTYPASGERTSSIPYYLRKGFDLPTYENENSISAYNFYRLIQRASEVYMIYDTANADSLKSLEESRFVKQLIYDCETVPETVSYEFPLPSSTRPFDSDLVMLDEDRAALGRLFTDLNDGEVQYGFSASTLNSYLDCPRKFFFSRIMGMKEEKDLSDTVEANTFGNIFHYCMEKIYNSFRKNGGPLEVDVERMEEIRRMAASDDWLDGFIRQAFESEMRVRRIEGQNLIIKESVKVYIRRTLAADLSKAEQPYRLIDNEYKISLDMGPEFGHAYFKGSLDRVEEVSGIPRICDYKTGSFLDLGTSGLTSTLESGGFEFNPVPYYFPYKDIPDKEFDESLEKMFSTDVKRSHYYSILFQLLVYALLYSRRTGKKPPFRLSVYQLPVLDKCGPVTFGISQEQLGRFAARLSSLMALIRSKAQTPGSVMEVCPDNKTCQMCDFKKYCRRVKEDE